MRFLLFIPCLIFSTQTFAGDLVGQANFKCYSQKDFSHVQRSNCLSDYLENEVELKMHFVLEAAQKRTKNFDDAMNEHGGAQRENLKLLNDSQDAFENYMNKECLRVRAKYDTGNYAAEGEMFCKIKLIERRMEDIEADENRKN